MKNIQAHRALGHRVFRDPAGDYPRCIDCEERAFTRWQEKQRRSALQRYRRSRQRAKQPAADVPGESTRR